MARECSSVFGLKVHSDPSCTCTRMLNIPWSSTQQLLQYTKEQQVVALGRTSACRMRMRCCLRSWKKRWRCRNLPGTCTLSSSSRALLALITGANVNSSVVPAACCAPDQV